MRCLRFNISHFFGFCHPDLQTGTMETLVSTRMVSTILFDVSGAHVINGNMQRSQPDVLTEAVLEVFKLFHMRDLEVQPGEL